MISKSERAERRKVCEAQVALHRGKVAEYAGGNWWNRELAMLDAMDEMDRELAEVKQGYHALDANWSAVHNAALNAIYNALGKPDATIPEVCQFIINARASQQ